MSETTTNLYHRIRALVLRDIKSALAGSSSAGGLTGTVIEGHSHDDRYFTETEGDSRYVEAAGDNLTGNLSANVGVLIDGVDVSAHAASSVEHGATGAVAGTTNTQTLTNKTLTTPTISATGFTNAQHAHAGASSGGQTAHTSLTSIGTNTHAQIDTHIALTDNHVAHSGVTLTAGNGLTGGGTIAASRSFAVGTPGAATATSTDATTADSHTHSIDATIARSAITITSGSGLTGGGNLTANRSLAVGAGLGLTVNADDVALTTPGTLTVATTNSSSGNHTHAVTSSSNPGAAAAVLATDASGTLALENLHAESFHASTFIFDEFLVHNGTSVLVKSGGKLLNAATSLTTATTQTRTTAASDTRTTAAVGTRVALSISFTIDMEDPETGHAQLFSVGDILRVKDWTGSAVYDNWLIVNRIIDNTTYFSYTVHKVSGTATTLPKGAMVVDYGQSGDGGILSTAALSGAPYQDVFSINSTPWSSGITGHLRTGKITGVGSAVGTWGMVGGTDLSDTSLDAAQFEISDSGVYLHNIDVSIYDSSNNKRVSLTSAGVLKLGTDVGVTATTGFSFDPVGNTVTIGSASYTGTVTIYGGGTFTGALSAATGTFAGSLSAATGSFSGAITASSGSISGPLTMSGASSSISIGATPPTSATVGTGIWLGRTGLYGLASNVLQAKFDAVTGKITAGAGNVAMDANGLSLIAGTGIINNIRWCSGAVDIVEQWGYRAGASSPYTSYYQLFVEQYDASSNTLIDIWAKGDGGAAGFSIYNPDTGDSYVDVLGTNVKRNGVAGGIFIPLTTPLTSTSFDGDAFSTVGTSTLIDLSAVFGVPAGVKAVLADVAIRDSAAWGAGEYRLDLGPSSTYYYAFRAACYGGDLLGRGQGVVPCDANGDVYYRTAASGAGTLDVTIRIWGYWI